MSFCDPHPVVDDILTLQALYLEASCCVQMHRAACRNSRYLLKASSQERIARPWETCEANSVVINWSTIHESEITVPNPFQFVKQGYIFTFEHGHHLSVINFLGCDWCYCTRSVDPITGELIPEMIGESCKTFSRSRCELVAN